MHYADFVSELGKGGLNVRAFAKLVGMNRNSVSNYAHGEVPGHLAIIAALIAEMNVRGIDYRVVIEKINVSPKLPRGRSRPGKFGGDMQEELNLR
jgi:lambda repressor-like predicted transcriptional regulator